MESRFELKTTGFDTMSLDELFGQFLFHEQRQEHLHAAAGLHGPSTNVAQQS
jgi:hypothetical protein